MRFYTTEKLGNNMEKTPDGFLICYNVPIARTGVLEYAAGEISIEPAPGERFALIERRPEEVFKKESLESLHAATLVNEHPPVDVTPDNWRELGVGMILNPRRGTGDQSDLLLADIKVTCPDAISDILMGKREVSGGYDADYVKTADGRGYQRNIIFNHVALVGQGRCGERCSIRDSKPTGVSTMSNWKQKTRDAISRFRSTKDEAALKDAEKHLDEAPDEDDDKDSKFEERLKGVEQRTTDCMSKIKTHDSALEDHDRRLGDLEEGDGSTADRKSKSKDAKEDEDKDEDEKEEMKDEMPDDLSDDAKSKVKDSAPFTESFQDTVSLAEIIAPGVRIPTFDSAAKPVDTFRNICGLRRKALQLATRDSATLAIIEEVRGRTTDGADFAKMSCRDVRPLFMAVGAIKKKMNSGVTTRDSEPVGSGGGLGVRSRIKTPAELNELNRKKFGL